MNQDRGREAVVHLHRGASASRVVGPGIAVLSIALPWLGCTLVSDLDDLTNDATVASERDAGKTPHSKDGGSSPDPAGDDADDDVPDDAGGGNDDAGHEPTPPGDAGKVWLDLEEIADFGNVDCGKSGAARTALLHNDLTETITFGATLAGGAKSAFTVDPAYGTIEGGKTAGLSIQPRPCRKAKASARDPICSP